MRQMSRLAILDKRPPLFKQLTFYTMVDDNRYKDSRGNLGELLSDTAD